MANSSATPRVASRKIVDLFGLPFDAITLDETVSTVRHACLVRERLFLTTANVNFIVTAHRDQAFRQSVVNSDLCVADGMPIVWLARVLRVPIPERIAGADLFDALRRHPGPPISVYFFGGLPGVAERACQVLNSEQGGVRCVGFDSPGFGSVESMSTHKTIDRINAANADFVVVALGAVKGQAWIERNRAQLAAPVISHLGAVVNFVAGTVARAPAWAARVGLEWVWRIAHEPLLWRRYAVDAWQFFRLAARQVGRRF